MKTEFSRQLFEKNDNQNSTKSVQRVPCCSLRMEGQIDMTKLIDAFRNFTKVPKSKHLYKSVV